jgi:DNA-binding GntR family transcriptional regulator
MTELAWDSVVEEVRISPEDRARPVPLWSVVSTRLRQLIESGQIPMGARIENEVALSDMIGISRPTMRRALQDLVDQGLIVRKRGVGTQVVIREVRRPVELTSSYDDLVKVGRRPSTDVLAFEIIPATDTIALALDIAPRSDVISIERLRYADGEPLALMHNLIPAQVAKLTRADLVRFGLYECLRNAAAPLPRTATEIIGARLAKPAECSILGLERGAALFTMTRTARRREGQGVEYGSHIYRADRYAFEHSVTQS